MLDSQQFEPARKFIHIHTVTIDQSAQLMQAAGEHKLAGTVLPFGWASDATSLAKLAAHPPRQFPATVLVCREPAVRLGVTLSLPVVRRKPNG
jgi:hypothetical protein